MKFTAALFSALVAVVSANTIMHEMTDIKADSPLGMKILSKAVPARELEDNIPARELGDDSSYFQTWIAGYSLKFQGCHHISQWNADADGEDDVRIATKRLVRFRLCPTDVCSSSGCNSNYGDYIVDLNSYLQAWYEAKQTYQSFKCSYMKSYVCSCEDNGNENYSQQMCLWDCYSSHNMAGICEIDNPYGDNNNGGNQFSIDDYMECTQMKFNNNYYQNNEEGQNDAARLLADNSEWNGNFYVGPYCASQGGAIYLGLFTDDTCTAFADSAGGRQMYYTLSGTNLPYGNTNLIDMDCMSCKEPSDSDNNNGGDDADDADEVAEVCETIYSLAGKCEAHLPYGTVYAPNNNACNYMEGIKIMSSDGTVTTLAAKANKSASVFIGLFVVGFAMLSAYVYYLKTKLDRASINLAE